MSIRRLKHNATQERALEVQFRKYRQLKAFRLKRIAYHSFTTYMRNIKHLLSDVLLKKQYVLARHNDQSYFDEEGRLLLQEEDSIEEHNFFSVFSSNSSAFGMRPSAKDSKPASRKSSAKSSSRRRDNPSDLELTRAQATFVQIVS